MPVVNQSDIDKMMDRARMADGRPMSDERLREVFSLVKPSPWKYPINALVPKGAATPAELETAVVWFAGGVPEVVEQADGYRVTGAGYYEWIGS